jgi:hypothetical protein
MGAAAVNKAGDAATSSGQAVIGIYRLLFFFQGLDCLH